MSFMLIKVGSHGERPGTLREKIVGEISTMTHLESIAADEYQSSESGTRLARRAAIHMY